jgi:hypothetical protein
MANSVAVVDRDNLLTRLAEFIDALDRRMRR